MSTLLMKLLLVEFIIIGLFCLVEGRYALSLYWLGACVIQVSLIIGGVK